MTSRAISTSHSVVVCDVCERTLLRGEQAEVFVYAGGRHPVCELCAVRAVQSGWVREGSGGESEVMSQRKLHVKNGRSILARLRRVAEVTAKKRQASEENAKEDYEGSAVYGNTQPATPLASEHSLHTETSSEFQPLKESRTSFTAQRVHAVPAQVEQKIRQAAVIFNQSEHCQRVASVAKSLGEPIATLYPSQSEEALVMVVFAWEICWYRYAVDLGVSSVRLESRGSELDELAEFERSANAVIDSQGCIVETSSLAIH